MPLVLADRVRDTTTTTGTGTVTLSGTAPTGYQNFSVIGNGNTTYYTINAGSQWEVGIGTYSSTGPTLARNTVLESSNGNALVDFAAGTKDVFVTYPSDEAVYQDGATIAAGTAVLGVANGGTGVTTSTGTSSVVLSNSPTLVTPTLGAASATSIANALGAVGTPSYTFTGDLNTGMWSPAGDTLAFSTNGTERVRIRSNGLFGINVDPAAQLHARAAASDSMALIAQFDVLGITNPADSHGLRISADTVTNLVQLASTGSNNGGFTFLTGTNERMRITSAGNVGIGTDAPGARVDVVGVSDSLPMRVLRQGTYGEIIRIGRNGVSETASINYPTDGVFAINTASTERMRITSAGNVGIGTSAPVNEFEVYGVNSPRLAIRAPESISETPELGFQYGFAANSSNNTLALLRAIPTQVDPSPLRADLAFFTNRGDNNEECMRITAAGDVGIGTTTPGTKLDVNGVISASLGTVSAPSYTFTGDLNTGIFSPAADTLAFVEGGVEAMRITSTANVGVGTSSPSTKLDVVGAGIRAVTTTTTSAGSPLGSQIYLGDANFASSFALQGPGIGAVFDAVQSVAASLAFYTYSSATRNERMRLDPNGNLGIGTSAPSARLDILGTTSDQLRLRTAATEEYRIGRNASTGLLDFYGSQTGFTGYVFGGIDGERMRITSAGRVGIGTASPTTQLEVYGGASGTFTSVAVGNAATALQLAVDTSNNAQIRTAQSVNMQFFTAGTERMRITSAGGLAVGTTTDPGAGNIGLAAGARVQFSSSAYITPENNVSGAEISTPGAITFRAGSGPSERMRITATGDVGIGTSSPGYKLDIADASAAALRINTTVGGNAQALINATGGTAILDLQTGAGLNRITGGIGGTSNLAFSTASTERMRIDSSGNVGIGTASPARPLDVNGAIRVANASNIEWGGDSYYINGNTAGSLTFGTAGSDRMAITSTGSVGIGVASPGTTFDVALSTTGLPGLRASRSAVPAQYIQMDIGGGASARLFATGGNKAMYIINNNSGAGLGTATDSTFIQVPGPSANTPITAMYIESSTANVGIGTTAPAGRVHATNTYTNTSNTNFIADGNIPGLNLRPANGRFSLLASYGAANTSSIVLGTGTANPSTEAMRFDHSTGGVNVGAATPNAAAQLQVDSTTRGFLPPRMTTAQRDAIATPPNGLVLYNTSTDKLQVRAAGAWVDLH